MNGWTNSTLYYSSCIRLLPNFSEKTEDYFSSRHGSGVALSEGATVATTTSVQNAVAYTALPVYTCGNTFSSQMPSKWNNSDYYHCT